MAKKKKKQGWGDFDNFEDFMSAVRDSAGSGDDGNGTDEEGAKLEDFVVLEKVDAFCRTFQPATEDRYDERFDDSRLREFFKAYVCPSGDPLALYVERMALEGFHMAVDTVTCEPCIFAVRRINV